MTKDEIIQMAKDAGAIPIHKDYAQRALVGNENIERFAALVAEKEREACAKVCENEWNEYCDEPSGYALAVKECAAAIRARGNK